MKNKLLREQIEFMRNLSPQIAETLRKLADCTRTLLEGAPGYSVDSYFKDLDDAILYGLCDCKSVNVTDELVGLLTHNKNTWNYVLTPDYIPVQPGMLSLVDKPTYDLAHEIEEAQFLGKTHVNSYEFYFYPQKFILNYMDIGQTTVTFTPVTLSTGEDAFDMQVTMEFSEESVISHYAEQGIAISVNDVPEGLGMERYRASLGSYSH